MYLQLHGIESTTPAFQDMHDCVLKKGFPSKEEFDNDKVGFNYHVKILIMNEDAPEWEKVFAHTVL